MLAMRGCLMMLQPGLVILMADLCVFDAGIYIWNDVRKDGFRRMYQSGCMRCMLLPQFVRGESKPPGSRPLSVEAQT